MNKLIKVQDLKIGDEIIISSCSNLKYMKVLKNPTISTTLGWNRAWNETTCSYKLHRNRPQYKAIQCSIRQDIETYKNHRAQNVTRKFYVFEDDISKHNHKVSIKMDDRQILLVKREEPKKENIYG